MTATRAHLPASLLLLVAAACGGGDQKKDATIPAGGGGDQAVTPAPGDGAAQALPAIPDAPAQRPAAVLATFTIGNPQAQLGEIAAYVDAISPGMGAMVGANVIPGLAGVAGAPGLDGYDLSKPLHVVLLDPKKGGGEMLLVVGVADEQRLVGSVGGAAQVQVHGGFAAVGKPQALVAASPYALSNLARAQTPPHPHLVIYMNQIVDAYGQQLEQELKQSFGASQTPAEMKVAEGLMTALRAVDRIEASLEASATSATASFVVHPVAGTALATWAQAQKPADYDVAARLPKGPWVVLAAGGFDWTGMSSFWADVAAAQGNQAFAEYLPLLGQEVALAVYVKEDQAVRLAGLAQVKQGASKELADLLAAYAKTVAQSPKKMDSMQVKGKAGAYRTGGATLHMLSITPGPDSSPERAKEFQKTFGKGGLVSYFGVASDWLVFALDKERQAKGLAARTVAGAKLKTPKSQLGGVFETEVAASKERKESGLMVFDVAAMMPDPVAAKGAQVTVAVGFEGPVTRARVTIPPATARAFMQAQMGAGRAVP